jgi:hypothetical protein
MAGKEEYFHPLAVDERGLKFSLPRDATHWIVQRKAPGRGRPTLIYAEDDALRVLIGSSIDQFKEAVRATPKGLQGGRYKLTPVDAEGTQVGKLYGYTPPIAADDMSDPDDEDSGDQSSGSNSINDVLIKFSERIAERDAKAIDQYVALANRYAAVAEKAIEALGNQNGHLTKGYVQVRPVTLDPEFVPDGEDGADDKDFFESVAGAAPAFAQLWNAFQAFQASRRENMAATAAAASAGAAASATVDTSAANGTNGANGVHVGIKRPTDADGNNGQGT